MKWFEVASWLSISSQAAVCVHKELQQEMLYVIYTVSDNVILTAFGSTT